MAAVRSPGAAALLAAMLAVAAPTAGAVTPTAYSGTIVVVEPAKSVLIVGEVGPWRVAGGRTRVTHRVFTLLPSTDIVEVQRSPEAPSGFRGDWVETPLPVSRLAPGDFVTVEALAEGERLVALIVTVARPEAR